ncbi:hypothetical protein VKT23_017114 [Stygiomarasmius scandens]|uniref:Ricin B lectin domain-containing protein n=1 Tax=Marasmiellus scandens TaxID=2682957 RepID=A0ABR1IW80_9AGAR
MVNLLNLTVAAAAASVSILDHTQQFAFDLVSGGCRDYDSVQQFGRDNVVAQEWNLNLVGPSQFRITNAGCNTVLTYAGSATGANTFRSQIVTLGQSGTTWIVTPADPNNPTGSVRFVESASGLALTAWAADPTIGLNAPLTLENNRPTDPRQTFFIVSPL